MKTVGDFVEEFASKYIRKTTKEEKTMEDELLLPSDYQTSKYKKEDLTPAKRRELALECPLFMKGTLKKNSDTFRAWFRLVRPDGVKVPQNDLDIETLFERRVNLRRKLMLAGMCADIYGDGFLLIKFSEPDEEREDKLLFSPMEKAMPLDVLLLNPENIIDMKYNEKNEKDDTLYYHYVNNKKGEDKLIHPDRMLHVKMVELPFDMFGISKVDILINIMKSNADIDIATGDILKWFSHGIQVLTKEGMSKPERKKALELLASHPNYFALSKQYSLEVTKAESINPQPFYDYIETCIAAVLVMPKHVLTGIEVGRVTGAEVGYSDYYRDIKDNQDLIYTPLLIKLFEYLYDANDREFKYDIEWETTYIDEMSEAQLLVKRVVAATNAKKEGLITIEEGRRIISEGQLYLDPDLPIPQPDLPDEPQPPKNPHPKIRELTEDEKKLIELEKEKIELIAAKERKLGEEIIKEQEDLFKDKKDGKSKKTN